MDTLAKSIALRHLGQSQRLPQISILGYGTTITVGGNLVSSRLQQSLCDTIHQNTLIEYLADKWEIDEIVLKDSVCWTSIARARKQASFSQRKFITKWISGDTPSGIEMHRRQQRDTQIARFAFPPKKPWSISLLALRQIVQTSDQICCRNSMTG